MGKFGLFLSNSLPELNIQNDYYNSSKKMCNDEVKNKALHGLNLALGSLQWRLSQTFVVFTSNSPNKQRTRPDNAATQLKTLIYAYN